MKFLEKLINGAFLALVILHVLGALLSSRTGLFVLLWCLSFIGWFMPVAFIGYFLDPNCDHSGLQFIIIAIMSLITVPAFFATSKTVQPQ